MARRPPQTPWKVTRLTSDPGLSDFAALSPDGKLVAYASDRSLDGERDLYVKQVAGGQPIRLTTDGMGNTMPDFSPDGSKLVFRSDREGGGIFEIRGVWRRCPTAGPRRQGSQVLPGRLSSGVLGGRSIW